MNSSGTPVVRSKSQPLSSKLSLVVLTEAPKLAETFESKIRAMPAFYETADEDMCLHCEDANGLGSRFRQILM